MSSLRTEFQKELSRRSKEVLIKEAIIAIVAEQAIEQQQQQQQLQQAPPVAPANPPVSPESSEPQATEEVTVDTVIDKLNVIRGGSSFSDPEVYGQLTTFWNSIPEDQKTTLDGHLNSIGKIVSIAEPKEAQAATPGGNAPPNAPPQQAPGGVPSPAPAAPIAPTQPSF